jgi:3-isopropylmalate dehydratase small subunit
VNQGLPIIVLPEVVNFYKAGDKVDVNLETGIIKVNDKEFKFAPLPKELMAIFAAKGLVNWIKEN